MNVVFLSPGFPPTAASFCAALKAKGVKVLGIGDMPLAPGSREAAALTDYVLEPDMGNYQMLKAAVERLCERHGPIDRIESDGEHWLEAGSRLRDDFDVPGIRSAELRRQRSKLGMAEIFSSAGIATPPGVRAESPEEVRDFARKYEFPLVFKPDTGSGAADTFSVENGRELERALAQVREGYVVQPFVHGDIVTYDGLADRDGNVVLYTSHTYDTGIMQVRLGQLDGYYYSLREVPAALEQVGRAAVRAFGVRERFFHVEFFAQPNGSYVALEMNLRAPGGFTTDMMNAACEFDVYALWAGVLTGDVHGAVAYERKFHTAHAGRRRERNYRVSHSTLVQTLGPMLIASRPIPAAFAVTMGDWMYLLRDADLPVLKRTIALVHALVS